MKHILVPTDFSDNAWTAVKYAMFLFEKVRCEIHLLHVDSSRHSSVNSSMGAALDRSAQDSEELMEALSDRIEREPLNVKHRFHNHISHNQFVDAIRAAVQEYHVEYNVMGTKGASGFKEMTIGSHAGDVITKVKCPVLVVPEKAGNVRPNEIAFPTDFNINYKKKVLDTLIDILQISHASLKVVHVGQTEADLSAHQRQNKEFLETYLGSDTDFDYHFLSSDDLELALQHFVESRDIPMIAMIAKNLNFFQRLLFRPVVKTIGYHTHVPFLVLHE